MRRNLEYIRRTLFAPRLFASLLAVLVLTVVMSPMVFAVNVVTVLDEDGEGTTVVLTGSDEPYEILQRAGIATDQIDSVVYTEHSDFTASVVVNRAFPVTLLADGKEHTAEFLEGTVQELLEACDVTLIEEDYTDLPLDTALESGMQVEVHRITYETTTEEKVELAQSVVDKYEATLPEDAAWKQSPQGLYDVTYQHRYDNGELTDSDLLELMPKFGVREEGSTEFAPGVAISRIEEFEGVSLGADGLPTEYSWKMDNAIATAYSSSGGRGASGLGLYNGTVAVNPNVIPYGSRLFITSADGNFVYGYAIATDTGGAMMEGRVDIDLYFETNAECLRFGKRGLVVYVLEDE